MTDASDDVFRWLATGAALVDVRADISRWSDRELRAVQEWLYAAQADPRFEAKERRDLAAILAAVADEGRERTA